MGEGTAGGGGEAAEGVAGRGDVWTDVDALRLALQGEARVSRARR